MSVDAKTNEHKAALELLDMVSVKDKLIMGDAMFCQRELSKKVLEKKGIISGMSKTTSRNSSSRFCS
jgi:predicted transposase YbfD/YdcC